MFGYRRVREAEYDALVARVAFLTDTVIANADVAHAREAALLRELAVAREEVGRRSAAYDHITTRVNVLEHDNGQMRQRITGLPTIVPQIAQGSPIHSADLGVGPDMFQDVGDAAAASLKEKDMLHDVADGGFGGHGNTAASLAPGGEADLDGSFTG